jgi:hypothetical protein
MKGRVKRALLCLIVLGSVTAQAEPMSRLRFDVSMEGPDGNGRFGAEVACSRPIVGVGRGSIVAIAAPNAAGGQGRVYLFGPGQPAVPIQVLSHATDQMMGRFGAAIQFVDDLNGDLIDDLIIGAPGLPTHSEGGVSLFTSAISEAGLRYVPCGMAQGPQGFGEKLQALRAAGGSSFAHVVIANPRLARIDGFAVSAQSSGSCQFVPTGDFSETFGDSSEWGSSMTQVAANFSSTVTLARIFVSAPREGEFGRVYERSAGESQVQALGSLHGGGIDHVGMVVSGQPNSFTYVIGSPRSYGGRGSVAVYVLGAASSEPLCVVNNAQDEYSGQFGSRVRHLGSSFLAMFSSTQEVLALRRAEIVTGGALGFAGVSENGCSGLLPVNNCLNDPQQEQGLALAGGGDCQGFRNGKMQRLLVSGSPGWSGERGRVDIAFEEGILDVPYGCATIAGLTPSPATGTYREVTTNSTASMYSATPTAMATAITVESIVNSPESTPSYSPTPTPDQPGSDDSEGGIPQPSGGRQPIVVSPGSGRLPAPNVVVRPGEVEIEMPEVRPQLSLQQQSVMIRQLQKLRGISKNRAKQLLNDPSNIIVTYVIRYWEVSSPPRFSIIQSAHADDSPGKGRKVKQLRTRLNRITLRNLRPGAAFGLSYSVELSTKRPRSRLGVTQSSLTVNFRVD